MTTTRVPKALAISLAALVGLLGAGNAAHAQLTSGTIFGSGLGSTPGGSGSSGRDANWNIVALPAGFTPPSSPPYAAYVPFDPGPYVGGVTPQVVVVYLGGTNYWIAPQATTASLCRG